MITILHCGVNSILQYTASSFDSGLIEITDVSYDFYVMYVPLTHCCVSVYQ